MSMELAVSVAYLSHATVEEGPTEECSHVRLVDAR